MTETTCPSAQPQASEKIVSPFTVTEAAPYNLGVIFVFGLVFAWSYHRADSLVTPMVAHLINNATALVLLFSVSKSS
jgi:membrane protease YdiL (CAAX protease family)